MGSTQTLISKAYAAFNQRDIDGALALMTENVDWPKASEGGRVVGKQAIREYWTRQWAEFYPTVEPVAIADLRDGRIEVKVHQVVKSLDGAKLSDQTLLHVYRLEHGLIARMDIGQSAPAFARTSDG